MAKKIKVEIVRTIEEEFEVGDWFIFDNREQGDDVRHIVFLHPSEYFAVTVEGEIMASGKSIKELVDNYASPRKVELISMEGQVYKFRRKI